MGVTETLQDHVGGGSASPVEMANYVSTNSPAMKVIERVAAEIAPTDIPILLVGESGTGKEMLAWRIHELSSRRAEAFLKVRGSEFSSLLAAKAQRHSGNGKGARVASCKGTLFLDEICDLDGEAQAKLLAALPDGTGLPARGDEGLLAARLIGSSTRNLEEESRAGRFREELYFRLNGSRQGRNAS